MNKCKLNEFLKGRPVNRELSTEEAAIEYIEELERASMSYFDKSKEGNSFGRAFQKVKNGAGMRLPSWSEDVVIRAQYPDEGSKMTAPYLYVESRYGKVPWKETMIELFSDDWEIVE